MRLLTVCVRLILLLVLSRAVQVAQTVDRADAGIRARAEASAANDRAATLEDREASRQRLQEAARLFLLADDKKEAARVLNRLARLELVANHPDESVKTHLKALTILIGQSTPTTEVDNLNGLATAYVRLQKQNLATEALGRALKLSRQEGYVAGEAEALVMSSEQENYQNHVTALEMAQKAVGLWQTTNDKIGLARGYSQVGECYLARNMLDEARGNYESALELWRDQSDPVGQARALISLSFVEYRRGDWEKNFAYLTQARSLIDERAEPVRMGQIEGSLGDVFNEVGMPEQALVHFERTLLYFREIKDPIWEAYAIWGIGCTYYLLQNYPEAKRHLELALAKGGDNSILGGQSHEYLGRVSLAIGESEAALQHLRQSLTVYEKSSNPKEAAQARALMGKAFEQLNRVAEARQYYQKALDAFVEIADQVNQSATLYALGRLELKQNQLPEAEVHLAHSIEITENMRRVSTSRDLTTAFSATVHDRYQTYIDCLMRRRKSTHANELEAKAFQISELARGRALSDLLQSTRINISPGIDAKLLAREKELRLSLRAQEDYKVTLLAGGSRKEDLVAVSDEIASLENQYRQLLETIRKAYPAFDQISRPRAWDLNQIVEQIIGEHDVLLEYGLGPEKSYVWALTRTSLSSYELPPEAEISTAAKDVYQRLKEPQTPASARDFDDAAQKLTQLILSPVANSLAQRRRIIVVADGVLNYIPFQVLQEPNGTGVPLVVNYEIINAPSASILGQLQQEAGQRRRPAKVVAAFGDPVFRSNYAQFKSSAGEQVAIAPTLADANWQSAIRDIEPDSDGFDPEKIQPLFYARKELANLREVAGDQTLVATGFQASRENLAAADLTQYSIVHFATHGVLDPKHPERSGLFLSMVGTNGQRKDGFVGLADIYRLRVPANLVVLSACRTGLGKDVRGEGLIGLTRGFMYAGASSVVASLWKVDDEATAELMKRFYANMIQNEMPPAAALRAAQNSIKQEAQWNSPYYWAAFTLQGDYRGIIKPASSARPAADLAIIGVVMLLLVSGMYVSHRRMRAQLNG